MRSCCCLKVRGSPAGPVGMVLHRDGAQVIHPPTRPSQEQPREESEGGREQRAMSAAVGWGPGLAGGGHMASGGHSPGRDAWDDWDDWESSQEHETVSRVTVGKAPLSFHIKEVVKSVVRPDQIQSCTDQARGPDCSGLGSTLSPMPQVTHSTCPPSFPTRLFSAYQTEHHKTQQNEYLLLYSYFHLKKIGSKSLGSKLKDHTK